MVRLSVALVLCGLLPLIHAQEASINFAGLIPNANAYERPNASGIRCQYLGNAECAKSGTPINRFGQAFIDAGRKWTVALCKEDSDGDGLSNGQELGDPCCKWTPGATPARTGGLSHPGLASEKNKVPSPTCPSPSPSASVSAAPSPSTSAGASPAAPPAAASPQASPAASTAASPVSAPTGTAGTTTTETTESTPDLSAESTTDGDSTESSTGGESGPAETPSSEDDDDGSVCFPAHATVKLEDGSSVAMRDLRVGDRVQVASGRFSDVFMFSHKLADVKHTFVTLKAAVGARSVSLSLTRGHFLYANGKAVPAGSVRVGDAIEVADDAEVSCARVTEVKTETMTGLYNPQTVDGDIVVDGVRATTFTHSVKHVTAHGMMMPVRAMFRYFGLHLTALEGGADKIADMLPSQV